MAGVHIPALGATRLNIGGPSRGGVPTTASKEHQRELWSLSRFALGWPWYDPKNAAALACELIRWVTPEPRWVDTDSPEIDALDVVNRAEVPTNGPYRSPGRQRVCVDSTEVTEARFEISNVLSYVALYIDGSSINAPFDFGDPNEHPSTRLYWFAAELGKRAVKACDRAFNSVKNERWAAAGCSAREATEFLRKYATSNPVVGAVDGAGGSILNRINLQLAERTDTPTAEITARMFHCRVYDALRGKVLPPELEANLKPAFEAAWSAGEYEFSYSLLENVEVLAIDALSEEPNR
jgi:hypothetical protein